MYRHWTVSNSEINLKKKLDGVNVTIKHVDKFYIPLKCLNRFNSLPTSRKIAVPFVAAVPKETTSCGQRNPLELAPSGFCGYNSSFLVCVLAPTNLHTIEIDRPLALQSLRPLRDTVLLSHRPRANVKVPNREVYNVQLASTV